MTALGSIPGGGMFAEYTDGVDASALSLELIEQGTPFAFAHRYGVKEQPFYQFIVDRDHGEQLARAFRTVARNRALARAAATGIDPHQTAQRLLRH